ncbi:MAG TPA: hypothetical protein P5120_18655, partial [Spirochaetota bacterium]|nr:hypothetical protein [Spirochaetota bacterium]
NMWKLIYEDTFGFGEDRDPPGVDDEGIDDSIGFIRLWESVLCESISGTTDRPLKGFARFTLVLTDSTGSRKEIRINVDLYLKTLAYIKSSNNYDKIKSMALNHYYYFINNDEESFWKQVNNE